MTALERSRRRLVIAREEERRRLRRDLHDGLAPKLAALALTAAAAEDLIATDRRAAAGLIAELRAAIRSAVGDIRRLVIDLRPPTLDELGLVAALQERAVHCAPPARLTITVTAPDTLPALPAAIEVAAYRIVQEAMGTVVKHAGAKRAEVGLAVTDGEALVVEVTHDGWGMDQPPASSFQSMREWALELGGDLQIEGRSPRGGARIHAWLPLTEQVQPDEEETDGERDAAHPGR